MGALLSAQDYIRSGDWATAVRGCAAYDSATDFQSGHFVHSQLPPQSYDVFKFRRFRFNLIRFLRLPLDINEGDLRDAIMQCSVNVFAVYVARARRAVAESGGPVEVTVRRPAFALERAVERPPQRVAAV